MSPRSAASRRFSDGTSRPRRISAADVIATPADALNVFDFEEAAHRKVLPGHWAYMASGVDDDATLRANREGFSTCSCARGACATPPRWTCASICSARPTTARSSSARRAAKNRFIADGEAGRRARGQGARHAAVPVHGDVDRRRRRQQGARPPGLVSALRAEHVGRLRAAAAPRRSRRLLGDRARPWTTPPAATAKPTCARARRTCSQCGAVPRRASPDRRPRIARCTTAST